MYINFIDAGGKGLDHIKKEVQNSKEEVCAIYNIEPADLDDLAKRLRKDSKRKVHSRFTKAIPKPLDVFLVDKNHEFNFNGQKIDQKDRLTDRLSLATRAAKMGIWSFDIETQSFFWDEKTLEIYGIETSDFQFETFVNHLHEDDREQVLKSIRGYVEDENIVEYDFQYRVNAKNDEELYVKGKATIVRENGKAIKIIGVVWDFTEEKKAERLLREKNEKLARLEKFIDQSSDAIQVSDEKGKLIYINSCAAKRLGIKKEEVSNYHVWDFELLFKERKAWNDHVLDLKRNSSLTIESINFNQTTKEQFPVEVTVTYQNIFGKGYVIAISRDIAERKKSETRIRESEAKHRFLIESSQELICIHEPQGHYKFVSPSITKLAGYVPEELTGKNPYDFFHPDDIQKISDSTHKLAMAGVVAPSVQNRFRKKDGTYIWLDTYTEVLKDEYGNVTSLITGSRDISEIKEAEEKIRESEEMFSDIANNLPGLVLRYIILPDGTDQLQFVSDGCEELWEVSKESVLADVSKIWAKVHPDDLSYFSKSIEDSAVELTVWKAEVRIVMDDGRVKWISGIGQPKKLKDGSVLWSTIHLDITESKNAELKLKRTLQQLNLGIETGKLGIWESNVFTGDLDWNDQLFEIYGVKKSSFDYKLETFNRMIHPDDLETATKEMGKMAQGEVVSDIRFRIKRPNGQIRHIYASGTPSYNDKGELEKFIGINIDVTHIAEYQEQLEAALRDKDALFKELHHRIKNNLQMVSSLLFIKSSMTEDVTLKNFIEETSTKIHSISSIHEHLLQMQGVNELDIKDYLESLCKTLVNTYSYGDSQFDLRMNLDAANMQIDRVLNIGLIVNEILSNAMKYAYPKGSSGKIHVILKNRNKKSVLTVADEGVGIPSDKISGMTNSYGMQLISLFTRQIKGTLEIKNTKGTKYVIKFPTNV